ncbi:hypothetical protein CHUAL_013272 [Chamberlinius hualienensis]
MFSKVLRIFIIGTSIIYSTEAICRTLVVRQGDNVTLKCRPKLPVDQSDVAWQKNGNELEWKINGRYRLTQNITGLSVNFDMVLLNLTKMYDETTFRCVMMDSRTKDVKNPDELSCTTLIFNQTASTIPATKVTKMTTTALRDQRSHISVATTFSAGRLENKFIGPLIVAGIILASTLTPIYIGILIRL